MTTAREDLKAIEEELKHQVPPPLHSMLQKESKEEAVKKYKSRQEKVTLICPPTCTGETNFDLLMNYLLFRKTNGSITASSPKSIM